MPIITLAVAPGVWGEEVLAHAKQAFRAAWNRRPKAWKKSLRGREQQLNGLRKGGCDAEQSRIRPAILARPQEFAR
jgi:hypothetical protein